MSVQRDTTADTRPGVVALRYAIETFGTAARLAEALGISPQAVSQWEVVPVERVLQVEAITGVHRRFLRPDVFAEEIGREVGAAYLNRVLAETGMSPTGLAARVGVASTTFTRFLNCPGHRSSLSLKTIGRIEAATGLIFSGVEPAAALIGGDLVSGGSEIREALGAAGLSSEEGNAVLNHLSEAPVSEFWKHSDPLDAARDDLGDAIGLLIALNTLLVTDGSDRGRAAACVSRTALEKVRRFYSAVAHAGDTEP